MWKELLSKLIEKCTFRFERNNGNVRLHADGALAVVALMLIVALFLLVKCQV